jgi:sugar phosphate isomerase/epimerase
MLTRRDFVKQSLLAGATPMAAARLDAKEIAAPRIEISLAQWSLHRTLYSGKLDHLDFPAKARNDFGISAVEYVNGFFGGRSMDFRDAGRSTAYLKELLKRSRDVGVVNHLIMVDDEGPLAETDQKTQRQAVEDHKKWIEAARFLGCRTVRVNLHGSGSAEGKRSASVDSLGRLGDFARTMEINVVVENHGHESSNGAWLAAVVKQVARLNVGTLPDFGNFCLSHPWGNPLEGCEDLYDRYQGMAELLPFAKGVSAKSYDFDEQGQQPLMDYERLVNLVKASGFRGYMGIEFEGPTQGEDEGIRKTKRLLEKYL